MRAAWAVEADRADARAVEASASPGAAVEAGPRLKLLIPPHPIPFRSAAERVLGGDRSKLYFAGVVQLPRHILTTRRAHRCVQRFTHVRRKRSGSHALTNAGARQWLPACCAGLRNARVVPARWDGVSLTELAHPAVAAHALLLEGVIVAVAVAGRHYKRAVSLATNKARLRCQTDRQAGIW